MSWKIRARSRNATIFRMAADYTDKAQQLKAGSFLVREGASMEQIIDEITSSGASTCGSEIEYRIGVTRIQTRVSRTGSGDAGFVEIASFDVTDEESSLQSTPKSANEADTRYRVSVAEGVTSWQVAKGLKQSTR